MIEHQHWLRPGECATLAGCPTRCVLTAIAKGELRARRFNSRVIVVHQTDLAGWIREAERAAIRTTRATSANAHSAQS